MAILLFITFLFIASILATIYYYRIREELNRYYEEKEKKLGKLKFFLFHGSLGWWRGNSWVFFAFLSIFFGIFFLVIVISFLLYPETLGMS